MPEPSSTDAPDPRDLRFLRALVTVLTAVMIAGIVALVALLWARLPGGPDAAAPAPPTLPDRLEMPAGATVQAVTAGPGWWAVVTGQGDILLFDGAGALTRRIGAAELAGE
jgi:hypothetical protein